MHDTQDTLSLCPLRPTITLPRANIGQQRLYKDYRIHPKWHRKPVSVSLWQKVIAITRSCLGLCSLLYFAGTKVCNYLLLLNRECKFVLRNTSFFVVMLSAASLDEPNVYYTSSKEDASCHPIMLFVVMFLSPRITTRRIKYASKFKVMATKRAVSQGPMPLHPDGDPEHPGLSCCSIHGRRPIGRMWLLVLSIRPYLGTHTPDQRTQV